MALSAFCLDVVPRELRLQTKILKECTKCTKLYNIPEVKYMNMIENKNAIEYFRKLSLVTQAKINIVQIINN